jgi:CspA family cold shock protein
MPVGTVKWFDGKSKGYGFIQPDSGGRDVFCHISAVEKSGLTDLREGQRVEYDTEPDRKDKTKFAAINLKLLSIALALVLFSPIARAQQAAPPEFAPITIDKTMYEGWTNYISGCQGLAACRALAPILVDMQNLEAKALEAKKSKEGKKTEKKSGEPAHPAAEPPPAAPPEPDKP